MGEGDGVRFWFYDWVGVGPLCFLYPRVSKVVSNKECCVKECYVWDEDVLSWDVSIRRALRQSESVEFESLLSRLANVFFMQERS